MSLPRALALAVLGSALVSASARAEGDSDVAHLADGRSQRTNWQPPGVAERYGHAEVLVHASIDVVHRAVLDFGRYKDLVPEKFHNARIIGRDPGATDVYMQLPIMNGLVTLWQVMRFRDLAPLAPGWAMVEGWYIKGNLKSGNAAWTLHAVEGGYTVLKFDLLVVPGIPAPQVIIDEELRDAAAQAVEAIRDRVQGTAGPAPYVAR